jgi:hypothetical protein
MCAYASCSKCVAGCRKIKFVTTFLSLTGIPFDIYVWLYAKKEFEGVEIHRSTTAYEDDCLLESCTS